MKTAKFPLEDMKGTEDEPCLLVSCPTTQLAVELFHHTMDTLGEKIDVEYSIKSLIKQNIPDTTVRRVFKKLMIED